MLEVRVIARVKGPSIFDRAGDVCCRRVEPRLQEVPRSDPVGSYLAGLDDLPGDTWIAKAQVDGESGADQAGRTRPDSLGFGKFLERGLGAAGFRQRDNVILARSRGNWIDFRCATGIVERIAYAPNREANVRA